MSSNVKSLRYRGYEIQIVVWNNTTEVGFYQAGMDWSKTNHGRVNNGSQVYEKELAGVIDGAKQAIDKILDEDKRRKEALERALELVDKVTADRTATADEVRRSEGLPDLPKPTYVPVEKKRGRLARLFVKER